MVASSSRSEKRVYPTRLRGRIERTDQKYDDIFSAVVKKVTTHSAALLYESVKLPKRQKWNSMSTWNELHGDSRRTVSETLPYRCEMDTSSEDEPNSEGSVDRCKLEDIEFNNGGGCHGSSVDNNHNEQGCVDSVVDDTCGCGRKELRHMQMHQHIAQCHGWNSSMKCPRCLINVKAIKQRHVCKICHKFCLCMENHLKSHYRDRTSDGALMECRFCYRKFASVTEVGMHERTHGESSRQTRTQSYPCMHCGMPFDSRHARDRHTLEHFEPIIDDVWDRILKMQEIRADMCGLLTQQCPLCEMVMGSRKSFRLHVLHKHLVPAPDQFLDDVDLTHLKALTVSSDSVVTKMEPVDSDIEEKHEPDVKREVVE